VVAHEVDAGRRHQGGELFDELGRLEHDVRGAVAPAVLQAVEEPPIVEPREALARDGGPGDVGSVSFSWARVGPKPS
jgi:hypothetical protein